MKLLERQFRGVNYMLNGQRYEGWLPAGHYTTGETVDLAAGRDNSGEYVRATELFELSPGYGQKPVKWYVAAALIGPAVVPTIDDYAGMVAERLAEEPAFHDGDGVLAAFLAIV